MLNQTPEFDKATIAEFLQSLYGIQGSVAPLVSYEDQNVLITAPSSTYVLKIANKRWPIEGLQMQTEILGFLASSSPQITAPDVILSKKGEAISLVNGFAVRLLSYLEGEVFTDAPKSPMLFFNVGVFMGRFAAAMQPYTHPAAHRPDDLWNLDNVMACKTYIDDVQDMDTRARINRFFDYYQAHTRPKLEHLGKSVIHGDANEQNLLVSKNVPAHIAGIIDFGDMIFGSTINDLATTLAYTLLGEDNPITMAQQAIHGYAREFSLSGKEREVLFDLIAMRLVQSVTLTSNRAKQFPENDYIVVAQKPAKALLKKLEPIVLASEQGPPGPLIQ